ncbi:MAG: putative diguanylate cyclase YeaJ [Pelotomaculum sp. PtaU1.Bin035]|nr:MAG: putative diguanylate cyclase YeaJ [Pelotomaculum sp. PtaU1.Bin035]
MEVAHIHDFTRIICKSSRGIIYIAALIWIIRYICLHRTKIKKAVWVSFAGIPMILLGMFLDLWGELHPMPHLIKEIVGEIILTDIGIALILGSLIQLIEEISQTSRKHQRDAETDPLTGMFNRRVFFAEAERVLNKARVGKCKPALAIVDVDNMKDINDTSGHQLGDAALKLVAQAIRKSIRECDVAVRYGGDEFVILFPEKGPYIDTIQARLQKNLETSLIETWDAPLTISVGLADFPADGKTVDELLRIADARMYAGKNTKKQ